jgi:hypothetical protein
MSAMTRLVLVLAGLGLFAAAITACGSGSFRPRPSGAPVSLYMRNLTNAPAEFTMRPLGDPPIVFHIQGGATGGGCVRAPVGWELIHSEAGMPPDRAANLGVLAREPVGDAGAARSLWILVTPAGVTTGDGMPAWWSGPPQPCTD